MPEQRATVHIHRMFAGGSQGALAATVVVDDYKHPCSNARDLFVRDHHPRAGRYLAFTAEHYGNIQSSILFEVKYPMAVIVTVDETGPVERIVGGDFRWLSYAVSSNPEWLYVDDRVKGTCSDHGSIGDTLKCAQCVPTEKLLAELEARGHVLDNNVRRLAP